MVATVSLDAYLDGWAGDDAGRQPVVAAVRAVAAVASRVGDLIAEGDLAGALDQAVGEDGEERLGSSIAAEDELEPVLFRFEEPLLKRRLAEVLGVTEEEFRRATTANARELFGLPEVRGD